MIPAGFDYEVAESADHAIELLRTKEDAKLIAGRPQPPAADEAAPRAARARWSTSAGCPT